LISDFNKKSGVEGNEVNNLIERFNKSFPVKDLKAIIQKFKNGESNYLESENKLVEFFKGLEKTSEKDKLIDEYNSKFDIVNIDWSRFREYSNEFL